MISVEPSVPLYNTKAAWPKIDKNSEEHQIAGMQHPRARAVWPDVILVGAVAAMRYADFNFGA